MSHLYFIRGKNNPNEYFLYYNTMFRFILLFSITFSLAQDMAFSLGGLDTSVTKVMDNIIKRNYNAAEKGATEIGRHNQGVSCILEGMVLIGKYDDLGDTIALQKATKLLNKCKASGYWEALRVFQLGYTQSEQGHSLKGAIHTKSAAEIFEKSKDLDTKAFYAIYAYYMNNTFNWLPFVSDKSESHLQDLTMGAKNSKWFWPLFTTSLIWMHYDRKEYKVGLDLAENALRKIPNHPVFLQIKADMLYRLKNYQQAANIYEASAADYLTRSGKSLRYWCAIANLVRIYHDAGNLELEAKWKTKLKSPDFESIKDWMPASLMNDLKDRNLID